MKIDKELLYKLIEGKLNRVYLHPDTLAEIGEVEYINLHAAGPVEAGQVVANIEAEKAAIEIPIEKTGAIVKTNASVEAMPQILSLNKADENWLFEFEEA